MTGVAARPRRRKKVAKISISLPEELREALDALVYKRGETRSELIREALGRLLRSAEEAKLDAQYVAGYRNHPEDDAEVRASDVLAVEAAEWDPWEVGDETRRSVVGATASASRP